MLKILPRISIVQQSRNLSKIYKAVEEALADRKDPILNNREGSTGYTIFETEKFHNSDLLAEYLDFNYGSKFREYIQIKRHPISNEPTNLLFSLHNHQSRKVKPFTMPDGSVVEAIAINHVSITSNPVSNHRSSLSNSLKGTSSIKDKDQIKAIDNEIRVDPVHMNKKQWKKRAELWEKRFLTKKLTSRKQKKH